MYLHAHTLYSALRPFGCSVVLASYDELDGPNLYCLDPSGVSWVRYFLYIKITFTFIQFLFNDKSYYRDTKVVLLVKISNRLKLNLKN